MTKAQFVGQIQSLARPLPLRFSRLVSAEVLEAEHNKIKMWAVVKIQCIIRRRRAFDRAQKRRRKRDKRAKKAEKEKRRAARAEKEASASMAAVATDAAPEMTEYLFEVDFAA